jgi:hypothetical protein
MIQPASFRFGAHPGRTRAASSQPFDLYPPRKAMANAPISQLLFEPTQFGTRPEMLVSTVLHLMSHYVRSEADTAPCLKLASMIERHLSILANRADIPPVMQATCLQLSEQWASVVDRSLPPPSPQKPNPLLRLFAKH